MNSQKNVMNIEEKPFRNVEARKMDEVQMQKDMDYTFAQRILKGMCEKGLISVDEFDKITALNRKSFSPYLAELYD